MSNGMILMILGTGLAVIGTIVFIILKIWLHSYGKQVKEELKKRYE